MKNLLDVLIAIAFIALMLYMLYWLGTGMIEPTYVPDRGILTRM